MIEPRPFDISFRSTTPTQKEVFSSIGSEVSPGSSRSATSTPDIYEHTDSSTPILTPGGLPQFGAERDLSNDLPQGDADDDMPGLSMSGHSTPGNNRRRSRPQMSNNQRHSSQNLYQIQPPAQNYPTMVTPPPENISGGLASFQGSPLSYPHSPFGQHPGFVGQYTMHTQPSPLPMGHAGQSFAFSQYHVQDNMMSPNIHANYLHPPHVPTFPYSRHSSDGSSSNQGSYPSSRSSPMYMNSSSSPTTPHVPSTPGHNGGASHYMPNSQFQSLRYPSPMPTPFSYAQQFTHSPLYQPQYTPQSYGQPYSQTDGEQPQGAWYYVPHPLVNSAQGNSYHGIYPPAFPYSPRGQADGESPAEPSSSTNHLSPLTHSQSPTILQPERQGSQDHPRSSDTGPPNISPSITDEPPGGSSGTSKAPARLISRKSYHPNPPSHRSEWVMWCGNVPPDANHDELWHFFNQTSAVKGDSSQGTGVLSIFLISRSSCAFINYTSEGHLHAAIKQFNGVPLRSHDPRCPRLVCRVRRVDDDLRAGVGGQRGMGMHTKWVREQKGKQGEEAASGGPSDVSSASSPTSISERLAAAVSTMSNSSDEGTTRKRVHAKNSSSSGSFASTNSSFLSRNFPERYFILKSLTQHDLDLSVEEGVWATQQHNEEILDQAYRTSRNVWLIFGVNKSGEFYGYARMTGPIRRGDHRVSWASRSSQSSSHSPNSARGMKATDLFFSPSDLRLVDSSPLPVDQPSRSEFPAHRSAPPMLGDQYRLPTLVTPAEKFSLDQRIKKNAQMNSFHLDSNAPRRAMRHPSAQPSAHDGSSHALDVVTEVEEQQTPNPHSEAVVQPPEMKGDDAWGDSFSIEWISTKRLPFHRTRHLRNPWNHEKEIKVSRDGTELEPGVGKKLLEEWKRLDESPELSGIDGEAHIDGVVDGRHQNGQKRGASRPK